MEKGKLGFAAVWAVAVGGMVGGGIFSTLGVVIANSGQWAALSFVLGGLVAYATGHSLAALTVAKNEARTRPQQSPTPGPGPHAPQPLQTLRGDRNQPLKATS